MLELYKKLVLLSSVRDNLLHTQPIDKGAVIKRHFGELNPFQTIEVPWTQLGMDGATTKDCLVSHIIWADGRRHGDNYQQSRLLFFDFDNKDTDTPLTEDTVLRRLDQASWAAGPVSCYIHHSQSSDPQRGHPKLHVFVLLDREVCDPCEYKLIHALVWEDLFSESDKVGDLARCVIPGRSDIPSTFLDGTPLEVDRLLDAAYLKTLRKQAESLSKSIDAVTKTNNRPGAKGKAVYLSVDTVVQLDDGSYERLRELDPNQKPQFLCPHCGHGAGRSNPGKPNATYQFNSHGLPIVYCSSCDANESGGTALKGVYNIQQDQVYGVVREQLRDKYRNYFFLEDKLARVYIQTDAPPFSISMGKVCPRAINEMQPCKDALLAELAQEARSISTLVFNQEGDLASDIPSYEWRGDKLIGKNPAIATKVADNAFIEGWLTSLFGGYTDFIKQWLALFCNTNYLPLPVLVLYSKERGTGKNVFAEAICSIFEPLHSRDTDYAHFTEAFKGKLWYIDEQFTEGKALYDVIKQIGGNNQLVVNNKYGLKHQVDRNLSVILTTNNLTPMTMEADELQLDESNNQFFVLELKPIDATKRQNDIATAIRERLGHYIRTELKCVYTHLLLDPDRNRYRYGLKVPVTKYEKRLYSLSRTVVEREAEEVWDSIKEVNYPVLVRLDKMIGLRGVNLNEHNGESHIRPSDLRVIVKSLTCECTTSKILSHLQQTGRLGLEVERTNDKRLGYRIYW